MTKLFDTVQERINTIQKSERVTKTELSAVSREMLQLVLTGLGRTMATLDVQVVNRLIGVLTPMNKRTAILYFNHFLPFTFDKDTEKFGKLNQKKKDNAIIAAREFLENPDNDIWTWAEENVRLDKKPVDWSKKISSDIQKAMSQEDDPLTAKEVMVAVLAGGITAPDLVEIMEIIAAEEVQQADDVKPIAVGVH